MKLYLMYLLIFILTSILFIIIKDKTKALKITGIVTISSSILLILLTLIIKLIITNKFTQINISIIINYLFLRFIYTSLILFIIGLIEILISKYIISKKLNKEKYHNTL